MIGGRHQARRPRRQGREAIDRRSAHHRRGDEDGADAAVGQGLGLPELGAAHAHRAGRQLAAGDLDALVGLGMGPQLHPGIARRRRHGRYVALEGLDLDDQRGRIERSSRALGADEMLVQGESVHSHPL